MHVITGIKKNPPTPLKFCGYKEGFMNHSTIDLEKKKFYRNVVVFWNILLPFISDTVNSDSVP